MPEHHPPLPTGTRLLHIGPPKTGTTSLQGAFHAQRARLRRHGVQYAGRASQARSAANAVAFGRPVTGLPRSTMREWPDLVREVGASTARHVVVSSETFAHCSDERAADVLAAFGADRTQVVITARPLADMLPSSWQQYVQGGQRTAWEPWLRSVLLGEGREANPGFWPRSRIDRLAERWSGAAGVTVVALAERPRDFVLRTFERMLSLPEGVLVRADEEANASLPHAMVETIRGFNMRWAAGPDPSADARARIVEFGAVAHLRTLDDLAMTGSPTPLPAWALERANGIAAEMNESLRAQGVRVVGDLDALARVSARPVAAPDGAVPAEEAAALLFGMVQAARREAVRDGDLAWLGTADLLRAGRDRVVQRVLGRVGDRLAGSPRLHRLLGG